MFQSSNTGHGNTLATKPWWEPEPSTAAEPILKVSEPRNGLASSRWAAVSDDRKLTPHFTGFRENVAPIGHTHSGAGNQITDSGSDLGLEHEFSFNFGHKSIPQMSTRVNATHPKMFSSSMGGMHDGFNTQAPQLNYENLGGVTWQPQSVTQDQFLDAPVSFHSEIEMDDDGDVVMIDLSDPNTIMLIDKMARAEREASTTDERTGLKPEIRPIVSSLRISNPSCVFVIDTNFILSHLQLVNNLALSHPRWRNVTVMPWATIQELDGLKKSTRQNDGIEVAKLARSAINWAYRAFGRRDPGVWAQIKQEKCDNDASHGDAAILDCCVYFQMQGHPTVLLSHDKNLCLQAMSYNISIVALDNATKTAEDILSRFVINPSNPQATPVPNGRLAPSNLFRSVDTTHIPAYKSPPPPPHTQRPARSSMISATDNAVPTNFPAPNVTSVPFVPANIEEKKIQHPFYSTPSIDVPYLQYGTKNMGTTLPISSKGLQDSIYAPGNKASIPKSRKYAIPIVKSSSGRSESPSLRNLVAKDGSGKNSVDIKLGLKGLLQKISRELVINIVPLLKKCALDKLGDMDTLQHLNIYPEKQVHSVLDMERFFHTHWMTIFTEIFPDNLQQVFSNAGLNQRYASWVYWTEFSGPTATGPKKWEVRKWIEEWDLIWKRLIYTEREAMVNMNLVDEWRAALVNVGLLDD